MSTRRPKYGGVTGRPMPHYDVETEPWTDMEDYIDAAKRIFDVVSVTDFPMVDWDWTMELIRVTFDEDCDIETAWLYARAKTRCRAVLFEAFPDKSYTVPKHSISDFIEDMSERRGHAHFYRHYCILRHDDRLQVDTVALRRAFLVWIRDWMNELIANTGRDFEDRYEAPNIQPENYHNA